MRKRSLLLVNSLRLACPPNVVVIIENENTRLCAHAFSEEVRDREPV